MYKTHIFSDRPDTRLAPFNRLDKTDRPYKYGSHPFAPTHWKATVTYKETDVGSCKKERLIREETPEELDFFIIHPKFLYKSHCNDPERQTDEFKEIESQVELTPRRLATDPGGVIWNYLTGNPTRSEAIGNMRDTRTLSRRKLKLAARRWPIEPCDPHNKFQNPSNRVRQMELMLSNRLR